MPARLPRSRLAAVLAGALLAAGAAAQEGATAPAGAATQGASTPASATPASATPGGAVPEAAAPWLRWLDAMPFIPIPEFQTAPHSGYMFGLIPLLLSNNDRGETNQILAPDLLYSQYFGWGARYRLFHNISDDEKWWVVAGGKQYVEREFDAEYDLGLRRQQRWTFSVHANYNRSGTGRFFGFGNDTRRDDEATFIDSRIRLEGTAARNFTHELQLSYLLRADSAEVEQSALNSLPAMTDRYPDVLGEGDSSEVQQRLVLTYDTRDSVDVPRRGERLAAYAGFATRALGGSASYAYYGIDSALFVPAGPDLTVVGHIAARYMPSYGNAPFWALSSIGGDRSVLAEAQPLRAYMPNRFIDRNAFSASIEARTWVHRVHLLNTDLKAELAPFVDTGKVFRDMSGSPVSHLHVGGGLGFRVVTGPFIVGYLDIGWGNEGAAIFSGIDYPF